jgi:hypothetical protein
MAQLPTCLLCAANASGPRRLDISYPTSEFTKMVKMWDHYEEEKMSIVVRIIKRSVFLSNEDTYSDGLLCIVLRSLTMCLTLVNDSSQKPPSERRYALRLVVYRAKPNLG